MSSYLALVFLGSPYPRFDKEAHHFNHAAVQDPAVGRGWAAEMNSAVDQSCPGRPARLLVILNPKSGNGRAKRVWNRDVQPILQVAGTFTQSNSVLPAYLLKFLELFCYITEKLVTAAVLHV